MKKLRPVFILLLFLAVLEIFLYFQRVNMVSPELLDTDCYMRLVRVQELHDTADWFNSGISRSNAPYGETLHWTRPLDIFLLAGANIGTIFTGFNKALFWWGVAISPVFHLLSLVASAWAALPLWDEAGLTRSSLLFLGQTGIWEYDLVARPDHHSLLLLLFILLLGCQVRLLDEKNGLKYCRWGGLIAALAIWVSVESLAAVAMVIGSLGILWLWQKGNYAWRAFHFSSVLCAASLFFILVERSFSGIGIVEFDKISVVHSSLFALLTLFWLVAAQNPLYNWQRRLIFAFAGAGISLVTVQAVFPGFFKGPYAAVNPEIVPLWLEKVQEIQPLAGFTRLGLARFLIRLGPVLLCLPYMVWFFLKRGRQISPEWIGFAVGMAIYVPLALYQMRWDAYAEVLLLFPLTFLLNRLLENLAPLKPDWLQSLLRSGLIVIFCLGFFLAGTMLTPLGDRQPARHTITSTAAFLADQAGIGASSKTILTDIDFGPELLYRTPHRVIATPYHRNGEGILFLYQVMTAETDEVALNLLRQRNVDLILLYPESSEQVFYLNTPVQDTFYKRLLDGDYPVWLQKLPVPAEADSICLFQVTR